jgi:hypothetical protein
MDRAVAVAVDWTLERRLQPAWAAPRVNVQERATQLARENMRLAEENSRLRDQNADLTASAEMWIRLYEAALARTKQPAGALTVVYRPAMR